MQEQLAGIDVDWSMTEQQQATVDALVAVHGARALAEHALDQVATKGAPTYARAWLQVWRRLPPPTSAGTVVDLRAAWCGSCEPETRLVVNADRDPIGACPTCHPSRTGTGDF